ncbi:DNA-binding response regulator [Massilia sp. YMA4]|nr:DNA-binding response regulator [Massilia sp. YMA4]
MDTRGMMRALVIDDEPLARSGVLARLRGVPDVAVIGEHGDGASALAAIAARPPDLLFLDVEMPALDGMALLAALPAAQRPVTILLTAYEQFAVQAFALNVVDYLLKPVDEDRFAEALQRARQALAMRRQVVATQVAPAPWLARFTVRYGSRLLFVAVEDVAWIEASGDYATLHVGEREYLVREPLHRLTALLDPSRFLRVHRSAIVQLDLVSELRTLGNRDAILRLRDGTALRASRTYIDALLAALERQQRNPA